MIVCVCKRVSEITIAKAAGRGASFEDLQLEHGVATQCGKCECAAKRILLDCQERSLVGQMEPLIGWQAG